MERAACRRDPRLRPESDERWGYWSILLLADQGRPTRVVSERGIVDTLATLVAQDVFNLPLLHPWACHRIGRGRRGTDCICSHDTGHMWEASSPQPVLAG